MVLRSSIHFAGWILAVSVAALAGCSPSRTAEDRGAAPELRLEGVRFRLFRGDALRADGTASVLTYQRESTAVKGEEIRLRLHDARGAVELTAPAGSGTVSARTFEATGGLQAIRGTDTARTESARFDPGSGSGGQVVGDRPVELAGTGYRLRGNGFTLDPSVGEIALHGGTRLVAGLRGSGR
jgi:hypothetical protein